MSKPRRFYVGKEFELQHDFWLHNVRIINLWRQELGYQNGQQVVLFDGVETERLYRITDIKDDEAHLELITDYDLKLPKKNVYLLWALLTKEENERLLYKCTELGVSHFIPILAEHSENTGFDMNTAEKIIIKTIEQCGRSDIPNVREPMLLKTALEHLGQKIPLMICEQGDARPEILRQDNIGVIVDSGAGWSDVEKLLLQDHDLPVLGIGPLTLRTETAAITAAEYINRA